MKDVVVVTKRVPNRTGTRLGIVDVIRHTVERIKTRHPNLKHSDLKDVTLRRIGHDIQLTFYFTSSSAASLTSIR